MIVDENSHYISVRAIDRVCLYVSRLGDPNNDHDESQCLS